MSEENYVYILKTVNADMTSYDDFKWPKKGLVKCEDWDPKPVCGDGLHGFLKGEGDGGLACWNGDAKWLAVKVLESDIVKIGSGQCKFPKGYVVYCGDRKPATDYILKKHPGACVIGASVNVGDNKTAAVGYKGAAMAGDYGTATAGDHGIAISGYRGAATAGHEGTATAGYRGTATAGVGGTATAGKYGVATAGDYGTATAGRGGTVTTGNCGTATAGDYGTIQIKYWDSVGNRYKIKTGYIGENGLKPNVKYKLNENDEFVEA